MPDGLRYPEMVTIHEFMHQYWYGMSASNETEEAWLDEGFTQYYEGRILDATFGSAVDLFGITVGSSAYSFRAYTGMRNPRIAPPATVSWKFPRGSYGTMTYYKTAAVLATLEGMIGTPAMDSLMKTFFRRWQFKHPGGKDFIATANEVVPAIAGTTVGSSLDWFFDQTLYGTAVCDYAVSSLRSEEVPAADSVVSTYRSSVTVARLGDMVLPIDVAVGFSDGTTVREVWDGKASVREFTFLRSSPAVWAKVDPDRKIRLDTNIVNNSQTFEPKNAILWKYAAKALFWLQNLVLMLIAIG
jgi:hypothetical protein